MPGVKRNSNWISIIRTSVEKHIWIMHYCLKVKSDESTEMISIWWIKVNKSCCRLHDDLFSKVETYQMEIALLWAWRGHMRNIRVYSSHVNLKTRAPTSDVCRPASTYRHICYGRQDRGSCLTYATPVLLACCLLDGARMQIVRTIKFDQLNY